MVVPTIPWDDDKNIYATFHIAVVSDPVTNIFYRVYKHDFTFRGKSYYDFVLTRSDVHFGVEKYVDCELTDTDNAFSFHIVRVSDGRTIPITLQSNCEIKVDTAFIDIGKKYLLTITGESTIKLEFDGVSLF